METRQVKWKPTTRGGGIGAEVEFEMRADDYAEMKARQVEALATPAGPLRAVRLNEIRTLMDLFALGGTEIVRPAVARSADVPRQAAPKEKEEGPAQVQLGITGRFYGRDATDSEREAGIDAEIADVGPLKRGLKGHRVLWQYRDGERMTAYEAAYRASRQIDESDAAFHAMRRESTRLQADRGLLVKDGHLPNPAPGGRERVDAYRITAKGQDELARLGAP